MTRQNAPTEESRPVPFGGSALEVLIDQARLHPEICKISFVSYADAPGFEERSLNGGTALSDIFSKAALLSESTGCDVPLWDIAWSLANTPEVFEQLVAQALQHDLKGRSTQTFSFETPSTGIRPVQEIIDGLKSNFVLAVCSKCQLLDGSTAHIPMMDFRCKPSPENQQKVESSLRGIGQKRGYVLESGRSYHYYGLDLMDETSWIQFMGKCLLVSPLVDSRYIAHRLMEGKCALRVSTSSRHPRCPRVVACL
jgi:hypothetical protein